MLSARIRRVDQDSGTAIGQDSELQRSKQPVTAVIDVCLALFLVVFQAIPGAARQVQLGCD